MPKVAIIAALHREVRSLVKKWASMQHEHQGRKFTFFEKDELVVVCGGIGVESARRAAEAVIALPARTRALRGFRRSSRLGPPRRRCLCTIDRHRCPRWKPHPTRIRRWNAGNLYRSGRSGSEN